MVRNEINTIIVVYNQMGTLPNPYISVGFSGGRSEKNLKISDKLIEDIKKLVEKANKKMEQ